MEMKVITLNYEEITNPTLSAPQVTDVSYRPLAKPAPSFTLVQICEISANAFHYKIMQSNAKFF